MIETAIVLKSYFPLQPRLVLLNNANERLDGVLPTNLGQRLRPGYVISYHRLNQRLFAKLHAVELASVPGISNCEQLLFWQQILEICLELIPTGAFSPGVFELLMSINNHFSNYSSSQRHLLICYLLSLCGFYPEVDQENLEYARLVSRLTVQPGFDFKNFEDNHKIENFLHYWIKQFVEQNSSNQLNFLLRTI